MGLQLPETPPDTGSFRGDILADIDIEMAVNLVFGALTFVGLRNGRGWTEEPGAPERTVDTLLVGIAAT
jgi:hypothetical protein